MEKHPVTPDEQAPIETVLARYPLPTWRPLAMIAIAAITGAAIWAFRTEVDRIAVAPGVIAPYGQLRVVQHVEGGVAAAIHVREGDRVVAGQPLIDLDLGVNGLNPGEIQVRLDALALERARLLAEAAQIDLVLPEDVAERQPDLANAELTAYRSRKREHDSSVAVLRDQREQRELDVDAIGTRLAAAKSRREPLKQEYEIVSHLIAKDLSPKTAGLKIESALKELDGEIEALEIALPNAETALNEAKERELFERNRFRKGASERLREVEIDLARQRELFDRASNRVSQATVTSPVDGSVKNLAINTIGGVVKPGEPILEIVPSAERLVVEARLSPNDIGHVSTGLPVRVKISTYNYLTYGWLNGVITQIAADATESGDGDYFFRTIIETESDRLEREGDLYPISPGMIADVDIELGHRSIAEYLVEPVLKLRHEALQGR